MRLIESNPPEKFDSSRFSLELGPFRKICLNRKPSSAACLAFLPANRTSFADLFRFGPAFAFLSALVEFFVSEMLNSMNEFPRRHTQTNQLAKFDLMAAPSRF